MILLFAASVSGSGLCILVDSASGSQNEMSSAPCRLTVDLQLLGLLQQRASGYSSFESNMLIDSPLLGYNYNLIESFCVNDFKAHHSVEFCLNHRGWMSIFKKI